jgi:hypothetical protein
VALHPVFVLFEHMPMSESLFVGTIACCLGLAVRAVARGFRPLDGAFLGLAAGVCVLTRANGAAMVGVLGVALVALAATSSASPAGHELLRDRRRSRASRFALAGSTVFAALLLPWLVFTKARFGEFSLVPFRERNGVVYLGLHEVLDPSLPAFAPFRSRFEASNPHSVFDVQRSISERRSEAEAVAREIVREQEATHPDRIAAARRVTASMFLGGPDGPGALHDVRYWFDKILRRHETLAPVLVQFDGLYKQYFPGSAVVAERHGSNLWSFAALAYLSPLRRILVLGSVGLSMVALGWRRRSEGSGTRRALLGTLLLAYLATLGLHVATLAALDRFALPFDLVLIAMAALALADLARLPAPALQPKRPVM